MRIFYLTLKILYMALWFYWGGWVVSFVSIFGPLMNDKNGDISKEGYGAYLTNDLYLPEKETVEQERFFTYDDWLQFNELRETSETFRTFVGNEDKAKDIVDLDTW